MAEYKNEEARRKSMRDKAISKALGKPEKETPKKTKEAPKAEAKRADRLTADEMAQAKALLHGMFDSVA